MTTAYRISSSSELQKLALFLRKEAPYSWNMLATLRDSLNADKSDEAHAEFYVAYNKADMIEAALAHGNAGGLNICAPNAKGVRNDTLFALAKSWTEQPPARSYMLGQVYGPNEQVLALLSTLNLEEPHHYWKEIVREFLYAPCNEIAIPKLRDGAEIKVTRATKEDGAICSEWTYEFCVEALGAARENGTKINAIDRVTEFLNNQSLYVLKKEELPIAMCGVDSITPETHLVHSVWVVPEERRKGYAQAMVAGALDIAMTEGSACLVTDNPYAKQAYIRTGFKESGFFRRSLFCSPGMNSIISNFRKRPSGPAPR